jgi:hypothetical protein
LFGLFDFIDEWIRNLFTDSITNNYTRMFAHVNEEVGNIAVLVGQTPFDYNSAIYSMIRTLSETVIIPIAGIILTFVLCYELIQMILEKNNMAEFDIANIYKWIMKTFIAVFILTHTFDITMAVFDVAQHVVNQSAGIITGSLDATVLLDDLADYLETLSIGELFGLWLESNILSLAMRAISLCIFIIIHGRMIEIYLTISVAPIPFSTMANREWGGIGNNYLKSLFALGFQGFLIMVCVAIYAVLLATSTSGDIQTSLWSAVGFTLLLCLTLFRSSSLSKAIFNAN